MRHERGMLVAAPERWDEVCFAVPALRALVASGLGVGILCPAAQRAFWETIDGLEVIDFPMKAKAKAIAAEIRGHWQAALAWDEGLAAEVFQIANIERRLGYSEGRLKKRLTHPLNIVLGPLEHRVRFYLAAVEALGVETVKPEFFLPFSPGANVASGAILLCPDSDFGQSYQWPVERWVEIGERLLENNRQVAVASIGEGQLLGKILVERLGRAIELRHIPSLGNALPMLTAQGLIIAADGSLAHLASHAGATCVVLFGPNDPAWKRPLGKRHTIVRQHAECAPCLMPECLLDHRCQYEFGVERVWQAILEKWA